MLNGTFYLNNSGTRWVNFTNGVKDRINLTTESGKQITRTVLYYFSFGNFCGALISYKGKKVKVLSDSILND